MDSGINNFNEFLDFSFCLSFLFYTIKQRLVLQMRNFDSPSQRMKRKSEKDLFLFNVFLIVM